MNVTGTMKLLVEIGLEHRDRRQETGVSGGQNSDISNTSMLCGDITLHAPLMFYT